MEYQYKVIISNRTVYKEFEIQPDMDRVKLGTGSSCEFRLNPEAFFTGIEMEFRKNGFRMNEKTIEGGFSLWKTKHLT